MMVPDGLNPLAIAAATAAAFVLSSTYYGALAGRRAALGSEATAETTSPPPWKIGVELLRSLVVATVLAGLVAAVGVSTWTAAVPLGLAAWVAFPVVLLAGSVIWEDVPVGTAALHAGDWLLKLLLVAVIVTVWR